jgi:DNA end-binding protein Ku
MAARSSWKGFLKLSLVSVPVKAYTASASEGAEIKLNQLHKECNSRIQYKKSCPIHGEIPNDQIVSGFEYAKGQYVIVDTDELAKLRSEGDKAVTIDAFVSPDEIDPVYYGKSYYLVPDGPLGQKPYTVLQQAMVDEKRYGVAQVVLHNREQLVLLRPVDNLLVMSVLSYDAQVTKPGTFADEAPRVESSKEELSLAKMLVAAATPKKFDLAKYKDVYTEKLTQLIEAKVAGKEIVAPPAHHEAQIINLMDALKASVAQTKGEAAEVILEKPAKKMAPSSRGRTGEPRKRKSS